MKREDTPKWVITYGDDENVSGADITFFFQEAMLRALLADNHISVSQYELAMTRLKNKVYNLF